MWADGDTDDSIATAWHADNGIGHSTLRRIAAAWPRRAAMRGDLTAVESAVKHDPVLPDYPEHLVPFAHHPRFLAAAPEQRQQVLTGMWLGYNERVVAIERLIAEPAFDLIMRGRFPGSEHPVVRQAVQQSIVDEGFHTYLHLLAISRTRQLRDVRTRPRQPVLVTCRRLRQTLADTTEAWQRDLAVLVWGAVAETCINALLALIARDRQIQPMHSLITRLHLRDESAHGLIVIEVVKVLHRHMNQEQRRALARFLPLALRAFTEQDLSVLRVELAHAGVPGCEEILDDLRQSGSARTLVRDYSGAERMVRELGLTEQVEFNFPEAPDWASDVHREQLARVTDGAGR